MREIKFRAFFEDIKEMDYHMSLEGMFSHYDTDSCILMQYTGMKDKNNVDIYEGDIIKINNIFTARVIYEAPSFICGSNETNFELNDNSHHLEVIGNIYENPKLFDEKNDGVK